MQTTTQDSSMAQMSDSEGIFRFDTGPSLLLFPNTYRETYRSLGQDMASHLEVSNLNKTTRIPILTFSASPGSLSMIRSGV